MGKQVNPRADDFYTIKAKKEGYPARSVYKLQEIQQKFRIFGKSSRIIDIGAAPGSWSLYVLRNLNQNGLLAAVDLSPLQINHKGDNFFFYQGDAFEDKTISLLSQHAPFDVILSDAAPATTGNRTVDTAKSFQLVSSVLELSEKILSPGGNIVIKIFQGGEEKEIITKMKNQFKEVKSFKPEAVRKISFETYLIGKGKNGEIRIK